MITAPAAAKAATDVRKWWPHRSRSTECVRAEAGGMRTRTTGRAGQQQDKDEMATRHGAWGGAAVGAVVGILFPPAIIGTAIVGAAVGGVGGHLWRGMSRADVMEFGDIIDEGQAALVIVGESTVERAVDKAALKAEKHVAKELDVSPKDVHKAGRTGRQPADDAPAGA